MFFLYDLAGKGADDLIQLLKLTKRKALADQRSHDARMIFKGERGGVTVLCLPDSSVVLKNRLIALAELAKYKSKAEVWLALGSLATSNRLVDEMAFAKCEWKSDPDLDKLATHLKGKMLTVSGKKIGRNDRCPCESGKKFKKCCGS